MWDLSRLEIVYWQPRLKVARFKKRWECARFVTILRDTKVVSDHKNLLCREIGEAFTIFSF